MSPLLLHHIHPWQITDPSDSEGFSQRMEVITAGMRCDACICNEHQHACTCIQASQKEQPTLLQQTQTFTEPSAEVVMRLILGGTAGTAPVADVLDEVEEEVEVEIELAEQAWSTEQSPVFLQMNSPADCGKQAHSRLVVLLLTCHVSD
jgi:hypothetical protein